MHTQNTDKKKPAVSAATQELEARATCRRTVPAIGCVPGEIVHCHAYTTGEVEFADATGCRHVMPGAAFLAYFTFTESATPAAGKDLLPLNSATYLRRMARELNALPDGFYFRASRWTRARVVSAAGGGGHGAMLQLSRPGDGPGHTESTGISTCEGVTFRTANGRDVLASREASR